MYHPGSKLQVTLKSYRLPLPDRVPYCSYSYSDHEAIEATLEISKNVAKNIKTDNDLETVLHDCMSVLNKSLEILVTHKRVYIGLFLLLMCVLLFSFAYDAPVGFSIVYNFGRVVVAIFAVFFLLMAILWNKIEKHAILAGKLSIEKSLKKLSEL